jgi:WD40 repeat protein
VPVYNNGVKTVKKGLASASEDGTIKIYFEEDFSELLYSGYIELIVIVNNGGLKMDKQKHLTLKVEGNHSKGFSSIEFHPDGIDK